MLFCASSHTHHLVPQGHLQCSRLLICKPGSVKEVVGDAQLYHVALVGGETHCWWGNREWVVVSPPEKLPLGGKHRAGLGVLGLQVSRAQPGTVGVSVGHREALSGILGHETVTQPNTPSHCTIPSLLPVSSAAIKRTVASRLLPLSH